MKPVLEKTSAHADRVVAALGSVSLPDLVQAVANSGKPSLISITHDGMVSRLWLEGGELVDAESGRLHGKAAAYRVFALQSGELVTESYRAARERRIFVPMQSLMLQAAVRKDECKVLRRRLAIGRSAYSRTSTGVSPATVAQGAQTDALRLVDGCRSLDEIVLLGSYEELEMLQAMVDLLHNGHIRARPVSSAPIPQHINRRRPPSQRQGFVRSPACSAAPSTERVQTTEQSSELGVAWATPVNQQNLLPIRRQNEMHVPVPIEEYVSLDRLDVGSTLLRRRRLGRPVIAMIGVLGCSAVGSLAVSWLTAGRMTPVLEVSVDPAQAEISLDGQRIGIGAARLRLEAAGKSRELQVSASGYMTRTWRLDKALPPKRVVLQPQQPVDAESVTGRQRIGPAAEAPFRPVESREKPTPPNAGTRTEEPPTSTRQGLGSQPTATASSPALTETSAADAVPRRPRGRPAKSRARARAAEEVSRPSPETSPTVAAEPADSRNEPSSIMSRALGPAADSARHESARAYNKTQLQMKIIGYQPPAVRVVD